MTTVFQCAFTILSDTRYLTPLRQWLDAVAVIVGRDRLPKRAVIACSLALVEAVNNAIFHAHERCRRKPIEIRLSVADHHVTIDVLDTGSGIRQHIEPSPDAMITHGRGIFLIRNMMSKVTNQQEGGRHRLRMIYQL